MRIKSRADNGKGELGWSFFFLTKGYNYDLAGKKKPETENNTLEREDEKKTNIPPFGATLRSFIPSRLDGGSRNDNEDDDHEPRPRRDAHERRSVPRPKPTIRAADRPSELYISWLHLHGFRRSGGNVRYYETVTRSIPCHGGPEPAIFFLFHQLSPPLQHGVS